jgi:molecular chaperone GrpE
MTQGHESTRDGRLRAIRRDVEGLMVEVYRLKTALEDTRKKAHQDERRHLLAMLDAVDNFERVLGAIEPKLEAADRQARNWVNSFRAIYKLLTRNLKEQGVVRIEAPEGKALPGFHNVVETRQNLELDDGTILEEWKRGYLWRGEVLRLAEVVAVKN